MTKNIQQYIQYIPDGSGRDGYINFNSGGFSRFIPRQLIPSSYEIIRPAVRNTVRDISKTSWTFKYKSDGSGRDSYILQGSGGLQRDYKEGKGFGDTLRKGFYDINDIKLRKSDRLLSNKPVKFRFVSKNEYFHSARLRKIQEAVTKRLYQSGDEGLFPKIDRKIKEKSDDDKKHKFISKSESNLKRLMMNDERICSNKESKESKESKENKENKENPIQKIKKPNEKDEKIIKFHEELKEYNKKHKKLSFNIIFDT